MLRRPFIKMVSFGSLATAMPFSTDNPKSHILTLSFDDGFKKSFYRIAEIHEAYGLKACLNVIATGHLPDFKAVDDWILPELMGDFNDWNKLVGRGHEIMPHSWKHLNLTKIPFAKAKKNINKCLDYFAANLDGYQDEKAVYNYAFLASNPKLDKFALERVAAVRTGAWLVLKDTKVNMIPIIPSALALGAWTNGPNNNDQYLEDTVNDFLNGPGGWLVINLHGLDNEGWGPISTSCLDRLLKRLIQIDKLSVLPAGEVIKMTKS